MITWNPSEDHHRVVGRSQFARFRVEPDTSGGRIRYTAQVCDASLAAVDERADFLSVGAAQRWCLMAYMVLLAQENKAIDEALIALKRADVA